MLIKNHIEHIGIKVVYKYKILVVCKKKTFYTIKLISEDEYYLK